MSVVTIGIDVGKTWFHLVGLDSRGAVVARQRFNQAQLLRDLSQLAPCLIGMEASPNGIHLARRLLAVGHDARPMSAEFIRRFVKRDGSDSLDAEAIAAEAVAQAVRHPTMRFVPVKIREPFNLKAIHSMRSGLVSRSGGGCNQIRFFP
jgi:transposase